MSTATADEHRLQGNDLFKKGEYQAALDEYQNALDLNGPTPAILANRAMCLIKLEQYGAAVTEATTALELDPTYVKCYFRRGTALCGTSQYSKALPDFIKAAESFPRDRLLQDRLAECRKMARMMAFQEAIAREDEASLFESLDLTFMKDDDTLGPLEDINDIDLPWIKKMIDAFLDNKRVSRKKLLSIVKAATELFHNEPTMTELNDTSKRVLVCGDTHGQFYDLLNIFNTYGWPSDKLCYLFNGDFVDRGSWSTEVALTLYALKIAMPTSLYINRGNHETDSMNLTYGFSGECKAKYGTELAFKAFSESFTNLPLASLIFDKYLVLHGGLFSKDGVTLNDIRKIDRFAQRQPGMEGLMMEMLWADPQPENGRSPSKRGVGLQFGPDITKRFCEENKLEAVIRSHEVREQGYEVEHDGKLITVFSAPNYCDVGNNLGAVISIDPENVSEYKGMQFEAVPHPDVPPMAFASGLMR